jgi:hypothetical protein
MLFGGSAVLAQSTDYPKWDFAAGYTINRFETPPPRTHIDMHGFSAAIGWNFRRWAALEGDFTYTGADFNGIRRNLFSVTAGPRFTKRFTRSPAQPYVHALIGGGHLSGFGSTNGWVGKFGAGVDIVAGKHIAIRAFEVDYYRYHGHVSVGTQRLNNMTATFGIRIF